MRRKKNTRMITLSAPDGYMWSGRQCLPDSEVWDEDGKQLRPWTSHRDFKTIKKAHNVLMSLPKGNGACLYVEYKVGNGGKVNAGYYFNSKEDILEHDRIHGKPRGYM